MRQRPGFAAALGVVLTLAAVAPAWCADPGAAPFVVTPEACGHALSPPPKADEVRVRFMGVSTLLIEDADTQILIDGFFTRPPWWKVKFGRLKPDRARIVRGLCRGGVTHPVAILVAHGHYDHALDAAEIAAGLGGVLTGSASVAAIGRGLQLPPGQIDAFAGPRDWTVGCFSVRAVPAPHASPDRWEGEIVQPLTPPAKASAYRNGGSFSYLIERGGARILVHPSAGSFPAMYAPGSADVVFLGVGGLGKKAPEVTMSLWRDAVLRTGAQAVYPIHWDNFTRALDRPLRNAPLLDDVPRTWRTLGQQPDANHRLKPKLQAFEAVSLAMPEPAKGCLSS